MVPEIPEIEYLEKISSAEELSPEGAWWITLQFVEHLINSISKRDKFTFKFLPDLMTDFLDRYAALLQKDSVRPLPNDLIQLLVEHSHPAASQIIKNPRTKIVKEDHMISPQKLKSPSPKTMNWLAKQPGRNIKEKIGVKNKVLSQANRYSFDTKENQVTIKLLYELKKQIKDRFEYGINEMLYDYQEADCLRYDKLEDFLSFINKIKNSDLANVKPIPANQPNNVLISDKYYSNIWRSYQELMSRTHKIEESWECTFERYVTLLCLGLAASLSRKKGIMVMDRVMKVSEQNGRISFDRTDQDEPAKDKDIEFVLKESPSSYTEGTIDWINDKINDKKYGFINGLDGRRYYFNSFCLRDHNQFDFLRKGDDVFFIKKETTRGMQAEQVFFQENTSTLKLRRQETDLEIVLSNRRYNRLTATFDEVEQIKFLYHFVEEVDLEQERGRGILFATFKYKGDSKESFGTEMKNYADMKGMSDVIDNIINDISQFTNLDLLSKVEEDVNDQNPLFENIAFDFMSHIPHIRTDRTINLSKQLFTVDFLNGGQLLQPKKNSLFELDQEVKPMKSIFFENKNNHTLKSFNQILSQLGEQAHVKHENYLIYTIPDSSDEFSQNDLKQGFHFNFKKSIPVWRSVAAAMFSQSKIKFKHGQCILVIDTHDDASNAVLLKVVENKRYQDIFFEHYAPYSVDDEENEINLKYFTDAYLSLFIEKYNLSLSEQQKQGLLRSGFIEQVVTEKKSFVIPLATKGSRAIVKFFFDEDIYRSLYCKWGNNLSQYLRKLKEDALIKQSFEHVLLIADHISEDKGLCLLFKNSLNVSNIHVLKTEDVLGGAVEINKNLKAKKPTWYEYLPNLSLQVIKDGHYDQLSLIEDESVENVMGEIKEFKVKETLILEKGHKHYDFPLIKGNSGKNNLEFTARIKDEHFPLMENMKVNLSVKYRYGYENSYKLIVTPADDQIKAFQSIVAEWVEEMGSNVQKENHYPLFPVKPLSNEEVNEALEIFKTVFARLDSRRKKIVNGMGTTDILTYMEDQIFKNIYRLRSLIASGNPAVDTFVNNFYRGDLIKFLINIGKNIPDYLNTVENQVSIHKLKDTSLLFLCSFGSYTIGSVFNYVLQKYKTESNLPTPELIQKYKAYGSLLCFNSHNGELLDKIIEGFSGNKNLVVSFSLRIPLWNDQQLIERLYEREPSFILNLVKEIKAQFKKFYLSTYIDRNRFRDYCELLLSILRLRENKNFQILEIGSVESNTLAKYIRKIDATLYRKGLLFRSRLKFQLIKPATLANMSDLAYACNIFLTGDEGVNLIQVTEVEEMY